MGNGFIKNGRNLSPVGFGVVVQGVHFNGLAFAGATATLAAQGLGGHVIGVLVQPSAQHHSSGKRGALLRQADEDGLSYILCQLSIPANQA